MFMETKKILENKLSNNTRTSVSMVSHNLNLDPKQSNSDNQSTTFQPSEPPHKNKELILMSQGNRKV